jgi:hypothetical protein
MKKVNIICFLQIRKQNLHILALTRILPILCACCTTKYNKSFLSYRKQGRKKLTPKLFYQTSLENLVPEKYTYRLIQKELDFHYLYAATSTYYEKYLKFTCKTPQIIALKMTFEKGLVCILQKQQYSHQNRGYKLS